MASTTDHDNPDTPSLKPLIASLVLVAAALIVTALLVEPFQSVTPATLWTTDACPSPNAICGQPAVGYLLPAAGGTAITFTVFLAGRWSAKFDDS